METTALLVIDVQKGLDDPSRGKRNNPDAESNIALLLSEWRKQELPIIHIRHCSLGPNSPLRPELPGNAFKEEARPLPSEAQFGKSINCAFIGTELEEYLKEHDISSLVIVGLTTDHCVSSSARMAANLGFNVTLVSDATATFNREGHDGAIHAADDVREISLVSLDGEFCIVRSTEEVLNEIALVMISNRRGATCRIFAKVDDATGICFRNLRTNHNRFAVFGLTSIRTTHRRSDRKSVISYFDICRKLIDLGRPHIDPSSKLWPQFADAFAAIFSIISCDNRCASKI